MNNPLQGFLNRFRKPRDPNRQEPAPGDTLLRRHPYIMRGLAAVIVLLVCGFFYTYYSYAKLIDEKIGEGGLRRGSTIYAAPKLLASGEKLTEPELIVRLQKAGYTENPENSLGYYTRTRDGLEIHTGRASYFQPHAALIQFRNGAVSQIVSRTDNKASDHYWLEPEMITNLMDGQREKRRPISYPELPLHVVQAIVSVEDKRFFQHGGLDLIRMAKAAYIDIKEGSKEQGASTVTMQLARSFWLDQEKTFRRKIAECFLTAELERRFSKEQILELYANEVYLGRRGSFSIHGFGEAARSYFGKDVRKLSLPEAAMLAGLIQRPSYYNPFKYPERMKQRRDLVLTLMHNNGYVDPATLASATQAPIHLSPGEIESSDAPYFVDLVNEDLQGRFQDWDFASNSYRVYSTLDVDLQREAVEAVRVGMQEVDKQIRGSRRQKGKDGAVVLPQVALVALDAQTGAIKALVGGRSYEKSQLNHVLAKRQPGSSFKPFVYAAALNSAAKQKNSVTMATIFADVPTTFIFNRQKYQPANYHDSYHGNVSIRQAMMKSLNIPTIKAAEKVGFEAVAQLARDAGIKAPLQGTPSLALGSYEVPPIEVAEAYTIFSNKGRHQERYWVNAIRDVKNSTVFSHESKPKQVLDPRVAYIMTNVMEDVIRAGTAAGVRSRGFTLPAAGKTGTAHDGWFAGYTDKLICVVWVGYDDYRELKLEGAKSALPVWTEFMKRAHSHKQYANAKAFEAPAGIVRANIDPYTGYLAAEGCEARTELFLSGTQPRGYCPGHYDDYYTEGMPESGMPRENKSVLGRIMGVFN